MGTPFTDIYDLFLHEINDYELDSLYASSAPTHANFYAYLEGYLIKAIPQFDNCTQPLTYTNSTFDSNLTLTEKTILATLMTIEWLNRKIQDVNQFSLHLSDTDFKFKSEAENLKQKVNQREVLREIVSQDMLRYGLKNNNWSAWAVGNYFV